MMPHEMMGARLIGDGSTDEQQRMFLEQQRIMLIEMFRQATAQQCLVAMIVKSMAADEDVTVKILARRAKEASDALCIEIFGEESQS